MVSNGYLLVDPEAGSDQHDVRGWTNGAFAWLAHEDAWPSLEHVGTIAFLLDDLIRALGFRVSVQEHEHGFTARSDDGSCRHQNTLRSSRWHHQSAESRLSD